MLCYIFFFVKRWFEVNIDSSLEAWSWFWEHWGNLCLVMKLTSSNNCTKVWPFSTDKKSSLVTICWWSKQKLLTKCWKLFDIYFFLSPNKTKIAFFKRSTKVRIIIGPTLTKLMYYIYSLFFFSLSKKLNKVKNLKTSISVKLK